MLALDRQRFTDRLLTTVDEASLVRASLRRCGVLRTGGKTDGGFGRTTAQGGPARAGSTVDVNEAVCPSACPARARRRPRFAPDRAGWPRRKRRQQVW